VTRLGIGASGAEKLCALGAIAHFCAAQWPQLSGGSASQSEGRLSSVVGPIKGGVPL
jgi:hypothetical protein